MKDLNSKKVIETLKSGGIGVIPTDTLYGVVGLALKKRTVEKIYQLRKRNSKKPFIILIGSIRDLNLFSVKIDVKTMKILLKLWPGKVSIILPCPAKKFQYLHRGIKSLAFRWPRKPSLVDLLKKTGPLVAPSANLEGLPPALTIKEAKKHFGDKVSFYIDRGRLDSKPSTLISIEKGRVITIRPGAVKIQTTY